MENKEKGWIITSQKTEEYTGIVVANGRIGILPENLPFKTKSLIVNNVYETEFAGGVSKIVSAMNFANLHMEIDGVLVCKDNISEFEQTLYMKEACFTTSFTFQDKARVTYTIYALRNVQYSGYIDVKVEALKNIVVKTTGLILTPTDFLSPTLSFDVLEDLETTMPILRSVAKTAFGKHTISSSATFIWHDINSTRKNLRPELSHIKISDYDHGVSFEKELQNGNTMSFAWTGAICTTQDFQDPKNESERFTIFNLLTPKDILLNNHRKLWAELWESDIEIEGNHTDQLDIRLALYHLYAFSRGDSDLSIAPMGLSSQNYNGHIFWDTELWMYPPLLLLNQQIARSLVNYRTNRLDKAKQKAINYGFKGAMFPWESDDTGEETTPSWALTGTFEHHITADIAIAFWNYYRVTKNINWLREEGFEVIKEIADFWVSRVSQNKDGSYSILNVVGANEFAANVNDNAFTNGAAIKALQYASKAAKALDLSPDPKWDEIASGIRIRRFSDGTTREHESYEGEIIKQADANLLTYPLNVINDKETILKDLHYYEPRIAEEGPAMGLAIFSIIHARLGNVEEAYKLYKKSYQPNKRPPFGALAETALINNPYFATGAGGMLQAILFGFVGLEITDEGIVQKDVNLPSAWKSVTVKGVGLAKKKYSVLKKKIQF